ncbi:MAG TPA: glycosyltransferase family 4 protein [Vicinamibacterales bacterium]|nr:glycosyltransferase family 4 protein [Vicinamibacterales bacterium]
MNRATRVTICLTHPVQYFAPWFRYMAAERPEIDLTVLYAAEPTPVEQGAGFERPFTWDMPLTDGYEHRVLGSLAQPRRFDTGSFFGVDAPAIGRAIHETRPDVVVIPGWHSISQVRALRACRQMRVPVVYRGDSNLLTGPRGLLRPAWALRTRTMLHLFDAWLSVGARSREYLRHFGVRDPLVFDSPHAVDNAAFAAAAERWRGPAREQTRTSLGMGPTDRAVLFAGKCTPHKRLIDLVHAVHRLGVHAVLIVAGDGPAVEACRREAARLGVRASWQGFVNQSDMPRLYAAADCLALPSASETWGLVVNEAMASGLPCVVSERVGAAPDLVIHDRTGEVFPVGDVEALAASIRLVHERADAYAAAGRQLVAQYSFARATDGLLGACRRLEARRRVSIAANPGMPRVIAPVTGMVIVFGLERMSFEVLRVLRERGAAIHCVVNTWASSRIVDLADEIGASWTMGHDPALARTRNPIAWIRSALGIARASAELLRDARRFRATHVFVPEFTTVLRSLPALWLLRAAGLPVILRLGNAPDQDRFYRRLWRWLIDPAIDRFLPNSAFIERELLAHGIDSAKVRLIRNTAPSRPVSASPVGRIPGRMIFVGQIIPPKGLDLLLEAVSELLSRGHDVSLDVVGNIDEWEPPSYAGFRASVRDRATRSDLAGRVVFLGMREDIPALLARASIHCCPSRPEIREGMAVVMLEAKRAGTPSVVFQTGSLPEVITHRDDGWICRDATVDALVEGLEYFLADDDRLQHASSRARASAGAFCREPFAAAWAEEFGVVVAPATSHARASHEEYKATIATK